MACLLAASFLPFSDRTKTSPFPHGEPLFLRVRDREILPSSFPRNPLSTYRLLLPAEMWINPLSSSSSRPHSPPFLPFRNNKGEITSNERTPIQRTILTLDLFLCVLEGEESASVAPLFCRLESLRSQFRQRTVFPSATDKQQTKIILCQLQWTFSSEVLGTFLSESPSQAIRRRRGDLFLFLSYCCLFSFSPSFSFSPGKLFPGRLL